jgi:hypothetical protein
VDLRDQQRFGHSNIVRTSQSGTTVAQIQPGEYVVTFPIVVAGLAAVGSLGNSVGTITVAVVVVEFDDGKISAERTYWDQASVLAQLRLIDQQRLPVTGAEAARKVENPAEEPSNALIGRAG